ncbi:MAG: iron-containing alcohol dehydrogenase [Promethearchaeota archaeon]
MWYFYSPNVIYGEEALDFLENISGKKCFVVTDKIIEELGFLKILTDKLDKFGKQYEVFNNVRPDPREEDVLKAREKCISYAPDLVIALGGGSVIDTAKATWALYELPESTIDDMHPFNSKLYDLGKKAKLIAIPTTSGTGAETTFAIVVSRYTNNVWQKLIQAHKGLIPTFAIVDPIFPMAMPPNLTISTGFDALSHAVEGMISNWKNEFSNALSLKAIELIFKYLPIAYKDGTNKEARDYMHQAATMAGLAFGNGNVHIGHTMGHSMGAVFHTPHGQAVGVLLNYVTQYCLNNPDEKDETIEIYAKMAKQLGWAKWDDDNKKAAYSVIDKIKELQKTVGFPNKIQELGISREEFDKNMDIMIGLCFQDASGVMTPRPPLKADYKNIYIHAYEGKDVDF